MKKSRFIPFIALLPLLLTSCGAKAPTSLELSGTVIKTDIHTEAQLNYIKDSNVEHINDYTGAGVIDESKSDGVVITIDAKSEGGDMPPKYQIVVEEASDPTKHVTFQTTKNECTFRNLKVNTKYNFEIAAVYPSETFISERFSFTTDNTLPRNMNVSTVSNFRDLGGYSLGNNKFIKQGMIYRSAEFNESYKVYNTISDNDISVLINHLKIKSDIDLRLNTEGSSGIETGGITSSPLGTSVFYYNCPMIFQGSNVLDKAENQDSVKKFFNYLADEGNYPLVFHCAQGKDRTGCLAYVIEALLGAGDESDDPLLRDYLFTNFSDVKGICKVDDIMANSKVGGAIAKEEGATLSEKTYNHLVNKNGIAKETLDKIISILTENK